MKEYKDYRTKKASMDSIAVPDTEKMKVLNDVKFSGNTNNALADEIFSGNKIKVKGEFDRATKLYDDPTRKKEDDEEEPFEDFSETKREIPEENREKSSLDKGVKVRGQYVKKKTVLMWCALAVALLLVFMFFFPPIVRDNTDNSKVLKDRNVFEKMGMTELKTYALSNYSVYNEAAFSSEKKENYRVVQLCFDISNPTPFEVTIPQYEVSHVDSEFDDRICYVTSVKKDSNGVVIGDIIPAFGSSEVTVEAVINVTDMTDDQFNDAVTSMIISTSGMKKKVTKTAYVPCIPAYMLVSNAIYVDLDLK